MAGRRPKPTAIKVASGNPGRRPLNLNEPNLGAADVRVPRGKLPKEAANLWRALAPRLAEAGVLQAGDLPALEMLCLHYAMIRMAWAEVEEYGLSVSTKDSTKKAPAASVLAENSSALRAYLVEFGLTPSSRVKIKTDGKEREKTLAEMLFEDVGGGDG